MRQFIFGKELQIKSTFNKLSQIPSKNLTQFEIGQFEQLMVFRQNFIAQKCQEFEPETFKDDYEPEVLVPFLNLLYCPVHKASSTTWYQNFIILWVFENVSAELSNENCHQDENQSFK